MRICPECNTKTDAERCAKDGRLTVEADRLTVKAKDPNIGLVIEGKYQLTSRIGRGGMGSVYKAVHRETGGDVAIKVMRADMVEDESAIRRFYIEAQNTHSLHHPNTVRIADFGQSEEGILFLVMEYVQGRSLQAVLKDEGQLSPARAVHVISQVLKSLGEAHSVGIIHRDIKPDNIMLIDQFGEPDFVKVLDFGISRTLEGTGASTHGAIGTPKYMSPEQWRGEVVDPRADLYACGGVLYRMLTGRHAFEVQGKGSQQIVGYMTAHLNDPPRAIDVDIPEALKALTLTLLAKAASDRPKDARNTLEMLRQVQKNASLSEVIATPAEQATPSASANDIPTVTPTQLKAEELLEQPREELTLAVANASATGFPELNTPKARQPAWRAAYAALAVMLVAGGVALLASPDEPPPSGGSAQTIEVREHPEPGDKAPSGAPAVAPIDAEEPTLTVTLSSSPSGATVTDLKGTVVGQTPLELAWKDNAVTLRQKDGVAHALKAIDISLKGFVTRRVDLGGDQGAPSDAQMRVTLKPLPVLRVTSNTPKTPVRLKGTTATLGKTPFDWTVSSEAVQSVEAGEGLALEFVGKHETISVTLTPDHIEGLTAVHGELRSKASTPKRAKKRTSGSKKKKKAKRPKPSKKGSGSWGW